jgi:predicted aconitase
LLRRQRLLIHCEEHKVEKPKQYNMELTTEEQAILDGAQGDSMRKALQSVVAYGAALGAQKLVDIDANPHLVVSAGSSILKPYYEMLDELIADGVKTQNPFTTDPRPMDYDNVKCGLLQKIVFKLMYAKQAEYEDKLSRLGLKDGNAFTCASYLPETGNIPNKGDVAAWSESSAVVFVNSVLGARTHRNSAGIDLLCNVVGKVPYFGLLTDEGRRATWLVEVQTTTLPNPQLLGSAIGLRVVEDVPYVVGLDRFLGPGLPDVSVDYMKDMGAAAATNGAVGLFHVENITPEAVETQRDLLVQDYQTYVIDDAELAWVMDAYPVLWKRAGAKPQRCLIGCPHLSMRQVRWWARHIPATLQRLGRRRVQVDTVLSAAPDVVERFAKDYPTEYEQLNATGATLSSFCPLAYMNNPLSARANVVTNSNKLRGYTTARFFLDEDILDIIATGNLSGIRK